MSTKTFESELRSRLNDIKERAAKAGTSLTSLCEATGISRATPDRWLKRAPKTIRLVDELEAALRKVEKEQAQ
jgi:Cro/C1-type HTH DNA-binding domain